MYKEVENFLSENNIKFIDDTILNSKLPFYHHPFSCLDKDNKPDTKCFLSHVILKRIEHRQEGELYNSSYYPEVLSILNSFFKKIKIKPKEYLRIAINYTYNNGHKKSGTHTDHPKIKHKQVLIYLNDCLDKNAKTVILDKNKKIIKEVSIKKHKAVLFGNNLHYHYFPKKGCRVILVCTFK